MLVRALELDETNAEAHALMGGVDAFYDWNYKRAEIEYRAACNLRQAVSSRISTLPRSSDRWGVTPKPMPSWTSL